MINAAKHNRIRSTSRADPAEPDPAPMAGHDFSMAPIEILLETIASVVKNLIRSPAQVKAADAARKAGAPTEAPDLLYLHGMVMWQEAALLIDGRAAVRAGDYSRDIVWLKQQIPRWADGG